MKCICRMMNAEYLTHILLALLVCICGCGAETDNSGVSLYDDQEIEAQSGMESEGGETTSGSMTGGAVIGGERFDVPEVWARHHVMIGLVELPAFGIQLSETRTILLTTVSRENGLLLSKEETCQIDIERPEANGVQTIIPQSFVDSLSFLNRPLYIEDNQISYAQLIQLQGVHLRDPINDELPRDMEDPRIFDQDQDGQPGLTLLIAGLIEGNLQIIQRLTTQLSGEINGDQMEGILTWTTEEPVINGSNEILNRDVPMTPHPELQSYFVGQRVGSEYTCADLIREADTLFWIPEL